MRAAASTASRRTRTASFIPEIESLRGVAITLVYIMHSNAWLTFDPNVGLGTLVSPLRAFALAGHTGVSLFFILSGYLLGRPFLIDGAGGPRVSRRTYYTRRVLRIVPLYVTGVVVGSVICA